MKRTQYRKPEPKNGRKSSRKKSQGGEEGRRIFSESVEENPLEEDPVLNRPFCIHSISPLAPGTPKDNVSRPTWLTPCFLTIPSTAVISR
jgi:hypothetical protein